jgi:hypothetical protein
LRSPSPKPMRALFAVCLAAVSMLAIAACGDDGGGGDEDPQQLLEQTFGNGQSPDSGVFELTLDLTAEGGENPGEIQATIGGPFQSGAKGDIPSFDVEGELTSDSVSGSAGLVSTGDQAFVTFQGSDYEVPAELLTPLAASVSQVQQLTGQLNPTDWLTDLENEGDSDVEGTETVHVSGTAEVPGFVEDLKQIAEQVPAQAGEITGTDLSQLDELTGVIESADFDFYTGADDDQLRKVEASLSLKPPDTEGAPESTNLSFSLTLSELNDAQEIAAPTDAQPLSELLTLIGLDEASLRQFEQGADSAGGGDAALPQAGGSPTPPSNDSASAYLQCLNTPKGIADPTACAPLLDQ